MVRIGLGSAEENLTAKFAKSAKERHKSTPPSCRGLEKASPATEQPVEVAQGHREDYFQVQKSRFLAFSAKLFA